MIIEQQHSRYQSTALMQYTNSHYKHYFTLRPFTESFSSAEVPVYIFFR